MKKQFFFSMLAAAAMLASCNNEDVVVPESGNDYGLIEGQPAFINVGIAMPSDPGTRANDNFNDGNANEYAVNSGKLVLFKGASEDAATLFAAYDIPTSSFTLDGTTNQITSTSAKFTQEISSPNLGVGENLYAYVILNQNGNATGLNYTVDTPFSTFKTTVLRSIGLANAAAETAGFGDLHATNGLVMTSVPVASKAGGANDPAGANITTLTPIEPTAVYDSRAAAEAASAQVACIYVERAAVKIDVTFNGSITDPAGGTANVALTGWTLGNVNNNASGYYNTRQFDPAWLSLKNPQNTTPSTLYRMVCGQPLFATDHHMGYRTYFGHDVNYTTNTGLVGSQVAASAHTLASGATVYTYENTFDENSQVFKNTTYVSFATVLNDGNDFWTIEGQRNTVLNPISLKKALASNIDMQIGSSTINTIKTTIEGAISTDLANASGAIRAAGSLAAGDHTVTFSLAHNITVGTTQDAVGQVTYSDKLSLANVQVDGATAIPAVVTAIEGLTYASTQTIGDKLDIDLSGYTAQRVNYYKGGVTYYTTRIGHFWNNETPWSSSDASFNDYTKIYPTDGQSIEDTPKNYGTNRANAWLGRWGILRNNWYSLEVTNISGIGDAVPLNYNGTATGPDGTTIPGDTPDDNPEPKYYISAHIHILPWVKRTQNVVL